MATWFFNIYLWAVYVFCPQALYQAMRASGAQWFECIDVATGAPSDACVEPRPVFFVPEDVVDDSVRANHQP